MVMLITDKQTLLTEIPLFICVPAFIPTTTKNSIYANFFTIQYKFFLYLYDKIFSNLINNFKIILAFKLRFCIINLISSIFIESKRSVYLHCVNRFKVSSNLAFTLNAELLKQTKNKKNIKIYLIITGQNLSLIV